MKKIYLASFFGLLAIHSFAQFTPGRIAVLRVGTGTAALNNASTALFLDEYSFSGTAGYSATLPTTGANAISVSGSATSEGLITLSPDHNTIVVPGYNIAPGTASVASSTSTAAPRSVVTVDATGVVTLVASTSTNLSGNNIRGAAYDGVNVWASGAAGGIFTGAGSSTGLGTNISSTTANNRSIDIFCNQLFYSTGSGSAKGIYRVGSGLPTTASTGASLLIDVTSSGSPYQFAINTDSTVCYIADDRAIASSGGIQKWTNTGGVWSLAYTLGTGTGSTVGARGLAVDWSGTDPVVYATTADASLNRIIKITDTGASSSATLLATAATNTIYRGITFTPGTNPLPVSWNSFALQSTSGQVTLKWSTASEINNSYFEVERSNDGKNYNAIAKVKGAGNSSRIMSYSYVDFNNTPSTVYYRIKQVDFDGRSSYSKVLSVERNKASENGIQATTPSPFNTDLNITFHSAGASGISIELADILGKIHYASAEQMEAGSNTVNINTSSLPNGIYFVRVTQNGEVFTKKVVKK